MLFPEYLQKVSFAGIAEFREKLKSLQLPTERENFQSLPDVRTVYREIEIFQSVAFRRLAAKGVLLKGEFERGVAVLDLERTPEALLSRLKEIDTATVAKLRFIETFIDSLPIDGREGLFRRAGINVPGRFR